jgi:hypothetical protein
VSTTDTVKAPEAVFPCESVAVQVTFVEPSEKSDPEAGEQVTGSGPSMSSTAVGATYETRDPSGPFASREKLVGSPVRTGGVESTRRTVTVNAFDAVFEWASVAVHVTVVAPTENVVPEAGLQLGVIEPSTLSLALAEYVTTAPPGCPVVTVKSPGTVIVGGVVSTRFTVTEKLPLVEFECASVAVQMTVVDPTGNVLAEAGLQLGVIAPSRLSLARAA